MWRIANALATGQLEAIPALTHEMAMIADTEIDTFNSDLDMLAYYGQLSVLVGAMRLVWSDGACLAPFHRVEAVH